MQNRRYAELREDHVPPKAKKIHDLFDEGGGDRRSGSARQHSCRQKQRSSRAGIVAGDGQQKGVSDTTFLLSPPEHLGGDGGRFEGKAIAPAAEP